MRTGTMMPENRLESERIFAFTLLRIHLSSASQDRDSWPTAFTSEVDYGSGRQRSQDVFPNTFLTQSHEATKGGSSSCLWAFM